MSNVVGADEVNLHGLCEVRLLWGSDSPYQLPGTAVLVSDDADSADPPDALQQHTYEASIAAIRSLGLGRVEEAAVMGETARRLFFFDEPGI